MSNPTTRLDQRFSEPGAEPTSWADTLAAIERAQMFWISTVRADGRPHVTPLVAVWLDDALYFSTGPGEQKHRNLDANSEVVLTTGTDAWSAGVDIVVEGTAVPVTDRDRLKRLAVKWSQKWDGRWEYGVNDDGFSYAGGTAHVFAVTPRKVLAFSKEPFAQTGHIF